MDGYLLKISPFTEAAEATCRGNPLSGCSSMSSKTFDGGTDWLFFVCLFFIAQCSCTSSPLGTVSDILHNCDVNKLHE